MNAVQLWEILVPTVRNNGKPYRARYHRVWDKKVQKIAKGLTILKPVKGKWVSPESDEFAERMIPVRIACSEHEIEEISVMTMLYYDQLAVMYYRVSDRVVIKHKNEVLSNDINKDQV